MECNPGDPERLEVIEEPVENIRKEEIVEMEDKWKIVRERLMEWKIGMRIMKI